MRTMTQNSFRALAALSLCLVFGIAHGQEPNGQDNGSYDADPPDRAARLSYIRGDVSMQPAGEDEWADAIVNRPLTTGDKLWLDEDARAEIYVGEAAVRLGSNTGFSFLNVDDDTIQMRMTAGVIDVNVHALDGNEQIEIDTPNIALSILRPGRYRVEVNDAGDATVVKVSEGMAEASSGSQSTVVHAQQKATFRAEGELVAQLGTLGAPDEFDSWSLERDRRDERAATSQTARYVSPDVTGYQDLDDNGSWSSEPEYGYVWTPSRVSMGWSPYRDGRWVWVAPWGWTWIDDAPWGYAPFHYGRWAHVRQRWCWVPGPRAVRAVYAPALVGWVGSPGLGVSVSVGGGGVGWFPLGPREVYVPGRRFSHRYVERVNVHNTVIVNRTHITNIYNNRERNVTYRNRGVPGAVTAVSRTSFASAQRVRDHRVRIDEREITRTPGSAAAPQIAPVRESRLGGRSRERTNARVPPRTVEDRQVVVKRDPPPAARHFVRRDDTDSPSRERVNPSQRPPQDREGNRVERDARPAHNDRPRQERPDTQPRSGQPRHEQPQVAVAPPVQSSAPAVERSREDRPQRWQRERQPQGEIHEERREADSQRRQQYEQQRQNQDNARAVRQQETRAVTQPTERRERQVEQRPQVVRPQAERPQRQEPRQERPQAPERQERSERQKPEPRQQIERRPEREAKRNQDDRRN